MKYTVMTTIELPDTPTTVSLFSGNEEVVKATKFFMDAFRNLVTIGGFVWDDVFIVREYRDPEISTFFERELRNILIALGEEETGSEEWVNLVTGLAMVRKDHLRTIIDLADSEA